MLLSWCQCWRGHGGARATGSWGNPRLHGEAKPKFSWVPEPRRAAPAPLREGGWTHRGQLGDTELVAPGKQRLSEQRPPLECASWRLLCSSRCPGSPAHPQGNGNAQQPWHSGVGCPGDAGGVPAKGHGGIFRGSGMVTRGQRSWTKVPSGTGRGRERRERIGDTQTRHSTEPRGREQEPLALLGGLRGRDHPGKGPGWLPVAPAGRGFVTSH